MNKYLILILLGVVILGGGVAYRQFFQSEAAKPVVSGVVREFTLIAKQNQWRFVPEDIEVDRGDKVVMTVINEDDYDHGLAIDAYGVSQRMPANSTITVEFTATQAGDFPFYCSVPCGEGEVDGKTRTHFDMVGKVRVREIVHVQNVGDVPLPPIGENGTIMDQLKGISAEETILKLATYIENGDVESALFIVGNSEINRDLLRSLDSKQRFQLASDFRRAEFSNTVDGNENYKLFLVPNAPGDLERKIGIILANGVWRFVFW